MTVQSWPLPKDPQASLRYRFDWGAKRLPPGVTIEDSIFITEGSVVLSDKSIDGGFTSVRVSGGEDGEVVDITNRVTLSNGDIQDQTGRLRIRSQ